MFTMTKALTIKQRRFVKRTLETGNPTGAAMEAYDTAKRNVASAIASENLRKPAIREQIEQALQAEGVTPRYVVEKLKTTLDAGAGVKATASDSVAAARVLLNTMERLGERSSGGAFGLTVNVMNLDKAELIKARQELHKRWQQILTE